MIKLFRNELLRSQAGVTLVELMVYVGMLGGVSLLVATLGTNMNRTAVVREADLLAAEFVQEFQYKVSRKGVCDYNFEGQNSTSAGAAFRYPNEIRNSDDSVMFSVGQKLDNYFTLSSMDMAKISDTRADITLQFTRSNSKSNAITSLTRKLKLTVEHEGDGTTIRSCLVSFDQFTGDQLPLLCNGEGTILSDSGTPGETSDDVCIHAGYSMERCPDGEYVQRFELINIANGAGVLQPFYRPVCIAADKPRSLMCPAGELLQGYSAVDGLICRPIILNDVRQHFLGDYTSCALAEEFPIAMVGSNINIHCGPVIATPTATPTIPATFTATATPTPGGNELHCVNISAPTVASAYHMFALRVALIAPLDTAVVGREVRFDISGYKKDGSYMAFSVKHHIAANNRHRIGFYSGTPLASWPSAEIYINNATETMNYVQLIRAFHPDNFAVADRTFMSGQSKTIPEASGAVAPCGIPNYANDFLNCGYIPSPPTTGLEDAQDLTVCISDEDSVTRPMYNYASPFTLISID